MIDIQCFTFVLWVIVKKVQDGVALNVFQKESMITIKKIILIWWIGKKFLIKLRMNKNILRKSIWTSSQEDNRVF